MDFLYSLDWKNIFEGSVGSIAFAVYAGGFGLMLNLVKRFRVWSLRLRLSRRASLSERVARAKQLLDGRSITTFKLDTVVASLGLSAIVMAVFLYVRLSAMITALSNPSLAKLMEAGAVSIALFGSILVGLLIVNVAKVQATLAEVRAHQVRKNAVSPKLVEAATSKVANLSQPQNIVLPSETGVQQVSISETSNDRASKS